jgi:hypothetical protein
MHLGNIVKAEQKPLSEWINSLPTMSHEAWLWIPDETIELIESTPCLSVSSCDLSPEEQEQQETALKQGGLRCLFSKDQIEDIADNLLQQKPSCSREDLFLALNFYWENDAFIEVEDA